MTYKLTVVLFDINKKEVKKARVEAELISEASILLYNERFYMYQRTEGRSFTEVVFVEVNPPKLLEDSDFS